MTPAAPGARRLVEDRHGRLVEQVYHPCGQWLPTVERPDPLAAAKGIGTALAAVGLFAFTLAALWATVSAPALMGGLVLAVALFACVTTTRRHRGGAR